SGVRSPRPAPGTHMRLMASQWTGRLADHLGRRAAASGRPKSVVMQVGPRMTRWSVRVRGRKVVLRSITPRGLPLGNPDPAFASVTPTWTGQGRRHFGSTWTTQRPPFGKIIGTIILSSLVALDPLPG